MVREGGNEMGFGLRLPLLHLMQEECADLFLSNGACTMPT